MQTSGVTKVPRLLVATEFPPNASGGGPAVVRQMLRHWSSDKLFWWSCLPEADQRFGQKVAEHRVAAIPRRLYPNRRWGPVKAWLLENCWARWAAGHFRKTIAEFKPDVIWVIPHLWAIPPLSAVLAASDVSYHITVQDYVDAHDSAGRFGKQRVARMVRQAEDLYRGATTRDATSHPMIADLRAQTGCGAAQMLHAALEESDFNWLSQRPRASNRETRIAYAGTIIVEREFKLFIQALKRVKNRLSTPLTLEIFSAHKYHDRPWFDPLWIRDRGNLSEEEMLAALRECAWGFAPMALKDADPRYNRFSFPTKFISYLAAGLPVITLGHPESSLVKMAKAYEVGVCLTSDEAEDLSAKLLVALSDVSPREKYLGEIQRCGKIEFDAARMRKILYDCFEKCAEETGKKRNRP
jgi:hypothetical protein